MSDFIKEAVKKSDEDTEKVLLNNAKILASMEEVQQSLRQTGAACKQITEFVAELCKEIVALGNVYMATTLNDHGKKLDEHGAKIHDVLRNSTRVAEEVAKLSGRLDKSSQFAAEQAAAIRVIETKVK